MDGYNFDWNFVSSGAPRVTISLNGIAFNSPAITLLGSPEFIMIGYDINKKTIGVKAYCGEKGVPKYEFVKRIRNGWARIGCKDFVRYLSQNSKKDFSSSKKYFPELIHENKMLVIDIEKEVND